MKKTQESNLGIQNDDINVQDIMYDMLIQSQIRKENHDHEVAKVDIVVSNVDVVSKHEHVVKDEDTLCEHMIYVV